MIYRNLLTTHFLYTDNVLKGASSSFVHKEMEIHNLQERRDISKQNKKARHRIMKPEISSKHCHSSLGKL